MKIKCILVKKVLFHADIKLEVLYRLVGSESEVRVEIKAFLSKMLFNIILGGYIYKKPVNNKVVLCKRGQENYAILKEYLMYLTIKETAEFLNLSESYIESLILQRKIRFLFDGSQYLIYKEQFNTHLEQMEKYKRLMEEYYNEPIPQDIDVKDED